MKQYGSNQKSAVWKLTFQLNMFKNQCDKTQKKRYPIPPKIFDIRYPISDIRYPIPDTTQVFNYEFPVIRVIHFFLLRFYSK